jgi:hypothetical protein
MKLHQYLMIRVVFRYHGIPAFTITLRKKDTEACRQMVQKLHPPNLKLLNDSKGILK